MGRTLGGLVAALAMGGLGLASGCYVEESRVMTTSSAIYAPPPAVDVYYEPRPGYVYVHGHYVWEGGAWGWQRGYYAAERPGFVYVQGFWSDGRFNDGHWETARPGYVHTGGTWEPRGRGYVWQPGTWEPEREGHVYVRGTWASGPGGTRTWERGRWEPRGGDTAHPRHRY